MIQAFGITRFCKLTMQASAGANANGVKNLFDNSSIDVYANHLEKDGVLEATARDYEAAAKEDYVAQVEDQKAERKLDVPTLVLYSAQNLGAIVDVSEVWKRWIKEGTMLEVKAIENGYGHFFLEEAPEISCQLIVGFLQNVESRG